MDDVRERHLHDPDPLKAEPGRESLGEPCLEAVGRRVALPEPRRREERRRDRQHSRLVRDELRARSGRLAGAAGKQSGHS